MHILEDDCVAHLSPAGSPARPDLVCSLSHARLPQEHEEVVFVAAADPVWGWAVWVTLR